MIFFSIFFWYQNFHWQWKLNKLSHSAEGPAPPPPQPKPRIPGGYKRGGDGLYYKFHGERKNWNDAQNICKREGGNLAIIFNEQTRNVVRGFMADGWIGLSDQW